MPKLTFYPLGNADTCLIDFANGRKALFDYADRRNPADKADKCCDLPKLLKDDLDAADRDDYDTLGLTHLDDDHTAGADTFFHLDHAAAYQGKGRIKVKELWVPAGAITESRNDLKPGARALQAEARYRLEKGYGIRVFSRPESLRQWLKDRGISLESRAHFITDAGQVIPGYTPYADGAEFFAHSPFGWRQDEDTVIDRNRNSLVVQLTFRVNGVETKAILGSDVDQDALSAIVKTTRRHGRTARLEWDIFKLPHHCSYLTLSPVKEDCPSIPVPEVKWLFETQGRAGCMVVSTSEAIPSIGSHKGVSNQPPHKQAADYYRNLVRDKGGRFLVTMEQPSAASPEPIVIDIDDQRATLRRRQAAAYVAMTSHAAPRAG